MKRTIKKNLTKEIAEELDIFDDMLSALVELLEEKGVMTHEEWENRIAKKLKRTKEKLRRYRDIQFRE